jgi:hypothetical protein
VGPRAGLLHVIDRERLTDPMTVISQAVSCRPLTPQTRVQFHFLRMGFLMTKMKQGLIFLLPLPCWYKVPFEAPVLTSQSYATLN